MKILAGVLTELVNIIVIIQSEDVACVVQNYISFGIISDIDNNVAESIFSLDLEELENAKVMYPVTQNYIRDW
jgi:hypothetical protein